MRDFSRRYSVGLKNWPITSELDSSKISFASMNKYYDSLWCVFAGKFLAAWR